MAVVRTAAKTLAGCVAFGAACAGLAWRETTRFTMRHQLMPILPPGARPVTVLHISDIHLLPSQKAKIEWVSQLQHCHPDLVINTGDNIASDRAIEPLISALGGLLDVPGFFVFGSNDYWAPAFKNPLRYLAKQFGLDRSRPAVKQRQRRLDSERLRDVFTSHGWVDLNNHCGEVTVDELRIAAVGTDDAHLGFADYDAATDGFDRIAAEADVTIGVTHAPYLALLDAMVEDEVAAIFAGHTHGGQVCLPGGRALVTNCDLDTARVKGLSRHRAEQKTLLSGDVDSAHSGVTRENGDGHAAWLHVSGGIGAAPYMPFRTFNRPEATIIRLVPRDIAEND